MKFFVFLCACSASLAVLLPVDSNTSTRKDINFTCVGACDTDVRTEATRGLILMGGGKDVDDAFQWMISNIDGGDIVVLRTSGDGAYNDYIYDFGNVNSVSTFVLGSRNASDDEHLVRRLSNAEAVFLAGGNQWTYYDFWVDTPVEEALKAIAKRGVLGGTSAGCAVLGHFLFTAEHDTVYSEEALADPYNKFMYFARDFLSNEFVEDVITDTHFKTRDRMGRLVAFIARIDEDGWDSRPKGVGVDERTALCIDASGTATVVGDSYAYMLSVDHRPEKCSEGRALEYKGVAVQRLERGSTFDFKSWSGTNATAYSLSVEAGRVESSRSDVY